jgi:hypothetical protein
MTPVAPPENRDWGGERWLHGKAIGFGFQCHATYFLLKAMISIDLWKMKVPASFEKCAFRVANEFLTDISNYIELSYSKSRVIEAQRKLDRTSIVYKHLV